MLNRREFIAVAATSMFADRFGPKALAAEALAPTAAVARPQLTPTEQLMYSTVRLTYQTPGQTRWGTGFIFNFFKTETTSYLAIVTNQHVVQGMRQCSFNFAGTLNDGAPDLINHVSVAIPNFEQAWIPHPSADLAIIPIAPILTTLEGTKTKPFLIALDQSLIQTDDELNMLMPVEQVLTVGFPGQLWDDVHNLPVFHRGYTATAPYIAFKGKKEFLIDFSTWPGASGSPVLLYNDAGWIDRKGNTMMGGLRAKLLGVVYGVAQQDVQGNVLIQAVPTSVPAPGQMSVPTNLGACISASRILEFEPLLVSLGLKPPDNYKMRAN